MMLSMEVQTAFLDRFLPNPRWLWPVVAVLAFTAWLALLLFEVAMSPSHPNVHLLVIDYKFVIWDGGITVFVSGALVAVLPVALVYASLWRWNNISGEGTANTPVAGWLAEAVNVAAAALKAWLDSRTGWFSSPVIAPAAQPEPEIYRDRVTMRERRAHRRAVHILTSRSAAKGDGHAAVALTYSFAANTA